MKDFLESLVSEATRKSYKNGIETFEKWYKKPVKELLKEKDSGKVLEKYWVWLKENYRGNTPRCKINPVIQFCRFNDEDPKIRKSLHIHKQIPSMTDHELTVEEARSMFQIGSLEEKLMIKAWLLGLRIGDATLLEWKKFDFKEVSEKLREIRIITRKEETPAHLFIDKEFQQLLELYLPTIDKKNPYLLQSNQKGKLSEKQLLRKLQSLQRKAGIEPRGTFGWHIARNLKLTLGTELGCNHWALKLMVGKSTGPDIWTYISRADLRKEAVKISRALQMELRKESNDRVPTLMEAMDLVLKTLRKLCIKELQAEGHGGELLGIIKDYSRLTHKEVLEEYLKET